MNLRKDELHVSVTTIILTSCKFVCIILEFLLRSLKTILVLIPLILYCLWVSSNRLIVVVFFFMPCQPVWYYFSPPYCGHITLLRVE